MAKPIVITGGGTGGHIFPMQAIAEQLMQRGVEPRDIRFVGSRRGQERKLLGGSPVALTLLPGRGIRRSLAPRAIVQNIGAVLALFGAVVVALAAVGRWRPSVVVSVGGYASFAVALAAVVWRRPLVLVDLDAAPGAAHRLLGRFARTRCTAFSTSEPRSIVTGAPLRDAVVDVDRSSEARRVARANQRPPIDLERRVVVVMTGSLGASSVNRAVSALASLWSTRRDRTIIHVTGHRDFDEVTSARPALDGLDYRVVDFGDMVELWSLCDVAICRAGATTVAELTALGICSVLVPLPGAPGDHQTKNAMAVVNAGGAVLVRDDECTGEALGEALDSILEADRYQRMCDAALSIGRRDAAQAIADVVCDVGGRR